MYQCVIKAPNYLSLLGEIGVFMVSFSVIIYKMMLKYSKFSNDLATAPNHFIRKSSVYITIMQRK